MHFFSTLFSPSYLIAGGMALLALHPLLWLINTWTNPVYDSDGLYIALLFAALLLWSLSSRKSNADTTSEP